MRTAEISGFVLAGGASRRFGSNKAFATVLGRSLLGLALRALRELGLEPSIIAPDAAPFARYRAPVVTGERPGLGPVEGVRVALAHSSGEWALLLAVDMPGVTAAALRPLLAGLPLEREPDGARPPRVLCYRGPEGRLHPFPGLYHRSLLRSLRELPDGSSMRDVLAQGDARALSPASVGRLPMADVLRNVNRLGDLDAPAPTA